MRGGQAGRRIIEEAEDEDRPKGSNVVDLMAALKKSLEKPGAKESAAVKTTPAKPAAKKAPAKRAPAKKPAERKRA